MINGQWTDLFDDFMQYTETVKAPKLYRKWSGISLIAGALGRRVWSQQRPEEITYPSQYIFLVGSPGTGKSNIIDITKSLWIETKVTSEFESPQIGSSIKICADSVTKASLIDEIEKAEHAFMRKQDNTRDVKYHSLLIPASEFSLLLPVYDYQVISVLNTIWDNPEMFVETRRTSKSVEFERPCINMLAGIQPGYLAKHFTEDVWETGISRRAVMIYATKPPYSSRFISVKNSGNIREGIIQGLTRISRLYGEFPWSPAAQELLDKWEASGAPDLPEHPKLQNYNESRIELLIKLMITSAASRVGTEGAQLEAWDYHRAQSWLLEAEKFMPTVFTEMTGKSDHDILTELYLFVSREWHLNGQKPVPQPTLWNFLTQRTSVDKAQRILDTAERSGRIIRMAGTDEWRPVTRHQQAQSLQTRH